jgi:hypothetical protein
MDMRELFFLLIFFCFLSCNNNRGESEKERILKEFDSINKSLNNPPLSDTDEITKAFNTVNGSLEKISNTIFRNSAILYDSLERKLSGNGGYGKIQQLYYVVNDFCGYLSDLEMKFKIACGDSTGETLPGESTDNILLTNNFFLKEGYAGNLFQQMKSVQAALLLNTTDSILTEEMNKWIMIPIREKNGNDENKFTRGYFYYVPPVAAITILHKFENDVRMFENKILNNYLNNKY